MMLTVRPLRNARSLPVSAWDGVVQAAGAPLFYRARFLTALERYPFYDVLESRFLVLGSAGTAVGVLPAYRVREASPIIERSAAAWKGIWVSHLPHWYDSWWPFLLPAAALVPAIPHVLATAGIPQLLLQNVGHAGLCGALARSGYVLSPCDVRYAADLDAVRAYEDWERAAGSSTRRNLRRAVNRAAASGLHLSIHHPRDTDVARVVELCRRSAIAHGNHDWLPAKPVHDLMISLSNDVVVHEIRDNKGRVAAAAVGFHDGSTYHSWSGGVEPDPEHYGNVDLNLLLYISEHRYAVGKGCARLEGGRRSGELKQRLGMYPIQLYSTVLEAA